MSSNSFNISSRIQFPSKILQRVIIAAVLCALFAALAGKSPAGAQSGEISDTASTPQEESLVEQTDQIMVRFKPGTTEAGRLNPASAGQMERISAAAGVSLAYVRAMYGNAHVLKLPSHMPMAAVRAIIGRLQKLDDIEFAEPDIRLQPALVPNDPDFFSNQWNLKAPTPAGYGIDAPTAWDITTGSPGVVVGVVDTGITNHSEFIGRTVPGYDFIIDELVANDGNGRDSDPSDPGDWITASESSAGYFEKCPITNSTWHGTHVTGIIGAASNNANGVAGVSWGSKILPVRVLGKCGGILSDVIDGMVWAAGLPVEGVPNNPNPAKVINLSLGGKSICGDMLQNAIDAVKAAGASVVVAAGNNNLNAGDYMPGNCNGVITVAATNLGGNRAGYSNSGSTVEISAPGGDQSVSIYSSWNLGKQSPGAEDYARMYGTSMAAPHVSGVASLLYSLFPILTSGQVVQILQDSATQFPATSTCSTAICGSGIVNAGAAVMEAVSTIAPAVSATEPNHALAGASTISLVVNGYGFTPDSQIRWNGVSQPTTFISNAQLSADFTIPGPNPIGIAQVAVFNPYGAGLESNPANVDIHTFADVLPSAWYWRYVEGLFAAKITGGCVTEPLQYCPDRIVTRAQMAVFLVNATHGSGFKPPDATGVFSDVPASYWAAAKIEQLAADGITAGCAAGMFCPNNAVTRAQMAIFLLRALGVNEADLPAATGMFSDVPTDYWAARWIEELARRGITSGCGAGIYCPAKGVTRAQMAVFMDAAFGYPLLP